MQRMALIGLLLAAVLVVFVLVLSPRTRAVDADGNLPYAGEP